MRMIVVAALPLFLLAAEGAAARDLSPPRSYTDDEQTLCQPDVFRLCNDAVPDEDRIIACMKANRASLSPECRKVFDVGMKKRRR